MINNFDVSLTMLSLSLSFYVEVVAIDKNLEVEN